MSSIAKKINVRCLDCAEMIPLPFEPVVGQIITCSNCYAEFEVITASPVELDWAFYDPEEEDEDWDEGDDDDDDDDED